MLNEPSLFTKCLMRYKQIQILEIIYPSKTIHPSRVELTNKKIKINPMSRKIVFEKATILIFSIPMKYQVGAIPWKIDPTTTIKI